MTYRPGMTYEQTYEEYGVRDWLGVKYAPLAARLLRLTQPDGDCWEFVGCRSRAGYGTMTPPRLAGRSPLAHRISYQVFAGEIPFGLQLDHLCRNRACVRPDHLEPVTARENALRGVAFSAVNAAKTHCPQGHAYDIVKPDGSRWCRTCKRASEARRYHERRAAA